MDNLPQAARNVVNLVYNQAVPVKEYTQAEIDKLLNGNNHPIVPRNHREAMNSDEKE